ncbi:unnamed protein product [Dimorphilus gyrociliatus]|nr:unnamed protein product [Dimorphilus gyrociliatus]
MAIGFALANSILIKAPRGSIIIDTTESIDSAEKILEAFSKTVDVGEIKAIIYTHNHADHVMGAEAFLRNSSKNVEIWAHEMLIDQMERYLVTSDTIFRRAIRQFGILLPKPYHINSGIGPEVRIDATFGYIPPNRLLKRDESDEIIAGLRVKLVHIPGETPDQIGVWVEEWKAFFCADDFYRSFPNLYAIRGTPSRDVMKWAKSLDKIRALRPKYLIPSHTKPIVGEEEIYNLLTKYRDAIQLVHDQTVRWMNKDMHPDDIARRVKLTASLKTDWLTEYYGSVFWSSKAVYAHYIGWFDGDISNLDPLTRDERSERIIQLAGGAYYANLAARKALVNDLRWALELSTHVLNVHPTDTEAKSIRLEALKAFAARQTSANSRNYYLTTALEQAGLIDTHIPKQRQISAVNSMKPATLFNLFRFKFNIEECGHLTDIAEFYFPDYKEYIYVQIRNGVILVENSKEKQNHLTVNLTVKVTWEKFREFVLEQSSPIVTWMKGDLTVDEGLFKLRNFMNCFEKSKTS